MVWTTKPPFNSFSFLFPVTNLPGKEVAVFTHTHGSTISSSGAISGALHHNRILGVPPNLSTQSVVVLYNLVAFSFFSFRLKHSYISFLSLSLITVISSCFFHFFICSFSTKAMHMYLLYEAYFYTLLIYNVAYSAAFTNFIFFIIGSAQDNKTHLYPRLLGEFYCFLVESNLTSFIASSSHLSLSLTIIMF